MILIRAMRGAAVGRALALAAAVASASATSSAAAGSVPRPVDVAVLVSQDSAVVAIARGPVLGVAESQRIMRRTVASRRCGCLMPDAWTFLEVVAPSSGRLVVVDGASKSHAPADPCERGGAGSSPFASGVGHNFAFYGLELEHVARGVWTDSTGRQVPLFRKGR